MRRWTLKDNQSEMVLTVTGIVVKLKAMKIVTRTEMALLEAKAEQHGVAATTLMENSGQAVASQIRGILREVSGKRLTLLIGPGNNGGDGIVAGRCLREQGAIVTLYLCASRDEGDKNLQLALAAGVTSVDASSDPERIVLSALLEGCDCVLDAVFGTGQNRPIEGMLRKILLRLTKAKNENPLLKIIALDLPSGLNADSGVADTATPYADYTVSLGYPKRGLFTSSGAIHAGEIISVDIGLPSNITVAFSCESINLNWVRSVLPFRSPYSHKGTFGKILVIAGSAKYMGAAALCCGGALRVGAGLVTLVSPKRVQSTVSVLFPETTFLLYPESPLGFIYPDSFKALLEDASGYGVCLAGCGLGCKEEAKTLALKTVFRLPSSTKLVLDADFINYLSTIPNWLTRISCDAVLTPHPAEMARLCGISVEEVDENRFDLVRSKASEWNKTIVLKGANTVVASPDGALRINVSANAGLATAGSGDVLAGVIAGLLAQGLSVFESACLGAYLHSRAGESVRARLGDAGMLASDIIHELPLTIKRIKETTPNSEIMVV
ncbi:MAG: NAD(P)H-hydrate dehydratase [Dehalococcoidia bacterium]|nr:NAD(P)H-hydrate dehydratase [Dehalococcoidia bacterium]